MDPRNEYWFPAKRFGWGWGPPRAWQGWVVLGIFFALLLAGAVTLLPTYGRAIFIGYTIVLCVALVIVCAIKGEPPDANWRKRP